MHLNSPGLLGHKQKRDMEKLEGGGGGQWIFCIVALSRIKPNWVFWKMHPTFLYLFSWQRCGILQHPLITLYSHPIVNCQPITLERDFRACRSGEVYLFGSSLSDMQQCTHHTQEHTRMHTQAHTPACVHLHKTKAHPMYQTYTYTDKAIHRIQHI